MSAPGRPSPGEVESAVTTAEHQALTWSALAAAAAIAWLSLPFAMGVFLGATAAFSVQPLYTTLVIQTRRPAPVAVATVMVTAVLVVTAVGGFVTLFVTEAVTIGRALFEALGPGGALSEWQQTFDRWLGRFAFTTEMVIDRLRDASAAIAARSAALTASFATTTFTGLLNLVFGLLTMYLVLRHWGSIVAAVERVSPLRPDYTRELLAEFRRVGRATLFGVIATGIVQGALAMLGYVLTGVPKSIFLGIATALASIVPGVGTLLVWLPAGVFLFVTGHPGAAVAELAWGALVVVGFSDYLIRPRLVGEEGMPALLTLLALFGGLETMGLRGLLVGPVIMAIGVAVLRLYAREAARARPTVAP